MERFISFGLILLTTMILCACAPFKPTDSRAAICNELNSQLIFGGSTPISRNSDIQTAQDPAIRRAYDKNCQK